eukprot:858605-Amphidinium_carterae.1
MIVHQPRAQSFLFGAAKVSLICMIELGNFIFGASAVAATQRPASMPLRRPCAHVHYATSRDLLLFWEQVITILT